jgi:predicted molibdopterin-dependent oxidoreductase YjgC
MGCLPNVYSGYQKVIDPAVREKFEAAWGCRLTETPGPTHTEMFDQICEGKVEAMYLVGENPILSEANANHVDEALKRLPLLVVQDIFLTQTAQFADVVLPAAAFAEKDGTFTNTERRVQRVRKAIDPPGEAKADWWITCQIAQRMGAAGFDFTAPEEIFQEIAAVTPSYGGISHARLEGDGLQWPCPTPDHPGTPLLHGQKFATPSGKGRFSPLSYRPAAELPCEDYPLLLTTDRSLFHYHTSTMTGRVAGLMALRGEELLKMHPADAARLGIASGDALEVSSRRGRVRVKAEVTDICPPGVVSTTFHFPASPMNQVTNNALDPVAKIPETKVCAVRVEKL